MNNKTIAEIIVDRLLKEKITEAFGVSGSHCLSFLDAMQKGAINYYSVKHESNACFMAAHYARSAQKVALCIGTAGPGILNMIVGIAEMYRTQLPAIIISPMVGTSEFGLNGFQEDTGLGMTYSINEVLAPLTTITLRLEDPEEIHHCLNKLFARLNTSPYGPVHFSIPANFFSAIPKLQIKRETKLLSTSSDEKINAGINKLAGMLHTAKNPVLLIGKRALYPSVSGCLEKIISSFSLPAITSLGAKGIIDENHYLALGVLDLFGHRSSEYFVKNADLVISIGYDFGAFSSLEYDRKIISGKHVQIDSITNDIQKIFPVDLFIKGEIILVLERLYEKLIKIHYKTYEKEQILELNKKRNELDEHWLKELEDTSLPLKPQRIYYHIQKLLEKHNSMVITDIGASSWWAVRYLKVKSNSFHIYPYNHSMGQGAGGVMGAKIANPDKIVICITGDGSFLMNGNEILTAKTYKKGIIYIVFVNSSYGLVAMNECLGFGTDSGYSTKFDVPDFEILANSYGIPGCSVSNEEALSKKLEEYSMIVSSTNPTPCLIAVQYDKDEILPIKPQLAGLFNAMQEATKMESNPFLMKAFGRLLKERI